MTKLFTPEDIRKYFYASCILAGLAFVAILYVVGTSGSANTLDTSLVGTGTVGIRHDSENSADKAMAENASIMYDYSRTWGVDVVTETAKSQFVVTSAKGGYKTQYAVQGSGADHKVDYRATKISGDASFASEITLTATEAGGESFDSMIWFDTRDGLATIQGRVLNSIEGRPATIEEIDPVGQFLLNTHLNVSNEPITPEGWLDFCNGLDQDVNMPEGIYILPVNDSNYNYTLVGGKIIRSLNATAFAMTSAEGDRTAQYALNGVGAGYKLDYRVDPATGLAPENDTEPEKVVPAAQKERAAKSS